MYHFRLIIENLSNPLLLSKQGKQFNREEKFSTFVDFLTFKI